ncbi:MAG: adenine phosphoribosyltransferase [Thermoleophilia bacterium]|jgi:adenine phosphoribosyltransferase
MELSDLIRHIPDYPKEGILFHDIMPVLQNAEALRLAVDGLAVFARDKKIDLILGAEARGFILGAALAYKLGVGFAAARKPGKLPWEVTRCEYDLEYGTDALEMHVDAIKPGQRVLIHDDLLATGGTAQAKVQLVEKAGGVVAGLAFIIELTALGGRDRLAGYEVFSLVEYEV